MSTFNRAWRRPAAWASSEGNNQVGECAVIHAPAALRRRDGQTDRQMGLTDARWTEENHILATLDDTEFVQTFDLLAASPRAGR